MNSWMTNKREGGTCTLQYTTVHAVSVKSLPVSAMQYLLVGPTLNYKLNVFFPWYLLMHKGGNTLNLNLNITGLFLHETHASTEI